MDVVRRATEAVTARSSRVSLVLKADIRAGTSRAIDSKVARIEERLAAPAPPPA